MYTRVSRSIAKARRARRVSLTYLSLSHTPSPVTRHPSLSLSSFFPRSLSLSLFSVIATVSKKKKIERSRRRRRNHPVTESRNKRRRASERTHTHTHDRSARHGLPPTRHTHTQTCTDSGRFVLSRAPLRKGTTTIYHRTAPVIKLDSGTRTSFSISLFGYRSLSLSINLSLSLPLYSRHHDHITTVKQS